MIVALIAIRFCLLLAAFLVLLHAGKKEHVRRGTGWFYITLGFGVVAIGSMLQLGLYIPQLHGFIIFSDPETNKILTEICGYYLGILLVLVGMWKLGPTLYKFYTSEDKLAESKQLFQTIINTSIEGIVIIQNGEMVFANPSLEKMLGTSRDELIGQRALDFIVKTDHDNVYARRDAILDKKETQDIDEYRLLRKDGEIRFAIISSQYINWKGKDAFLSVISDITKLKQAEENLSAIANTASEAIGIFQDERLVYCNPAMISTFGYTLEELQSRPFHSFVHPDDRPMLQQRYVARQSGETVPPRYDYRLIDKSGNIIWVMISAGITQWKGKVATVTVLTNITDRKQAEEATLAAKENLEHRVEERTKELIEINDQLIAISNQKSAFVSSASHELRTPLASILGFSVLVDKILKKHVVPIVGEDSTVKRKVELALHNLAIIRSEGDRLTRLLDDMLDVSKIEAGKMEWRDEALLVQSIVESAVEGARIKLEAKPKLSLHVEAASEREYIYADHDRIMQVLTNLLDNAIKFTEHGEIVISTNRIGDDILEFRVTDSGLGMTAQERALIFQKYYQAESPSKGIAKAPKGTGLGLAICKEIIEHYGGTIGVAPCPEGEGSSFYVRLPLHIEPHHD
ncbi:PAS domain S-box protein [Pseudodesulfovibrio cashew]|uniref:histidine kinase n=1 Tax=Pseudodesulfovibrio cashew TaxID=2678688 RepID=A0A6I6JSJ3_9BACT|nr:PAS domain-containing sensor histidine kinase [Pseudodesulfovibrio cashew]QGY40534.1 PAS domain S-box protein [Pseudodesulfovibrio cashew]